MRLRIVEASLLGFSLLISPPFPDSRPAVAQTQSATLRTEEFDLLVAPIALYPDQLLAQVLTASTYPFELAQAAQFVRL